MDSFNGPMKIKSAAIVTPSDEPFDKTYKVICFCGWKRDYGYMRVTAEREMKHHTEKHIGSVNIEMIETDAIPLPPQRQRKKLNRSGAQKNTTRAAPTV